MGGGDTYKGFPVPNPTVSYWQLPPHRIASHRTTPELPTSTTFDYVIVGSGITGAAVAYKLLSRDPTLQILMLEARTAASGASGRNGGHCRAGFWLNFPDYVAAFGEDEALKFERLEEQTVQDIANFVREHAVDCDFRDVETVDVVQTEERFKALKHIVDFREEVRLRRPDAGPLIKRRLLHGREAREHTGLPNAVGAAVWPAHTQNPYRLVCKMLELGLEKGLNLQTNTPAIEVVACHDADSSASWLVKTERGDVFAKQVVLATNAYTNALHRGLAATGFMWPSRSQVTALRPRGDATRIPSLRGSAGIDTKGSGDYFLCRAPGQEGEGDVLYGGGRSISPTREKGITDDSKVHSGIAEYLHQAPEDVFGIENWGSEAEVVRDWSGITCYTPDTFPLVGEIPNEKGLWMSIGMNGHGMAMAYRSAEALVEMMTSGKEPDWFPKPLRLARAWERRHVDIRARTAQKVAE